MVISFFSKAIHGEGKKKKLKQHALIEIINFWEFPEISGNFRSNLNSGAEAPIQPAPKLFAKAKIVFCLSQLHLFCLRARDGR
jgi:hypothetical protein